MDEQRRMAEYLRLDKLEERLKFWEDAWGRMSLKEAQRAAEKAIASFDRELQEAQQSHAMNTNDIKRWLLRREKRCNAADERVAAINAEKAAKSTARAEREAHREMLTEGGERLAKKAKKSQEPDVQLALMLDIFVQQGVISASYRKRAIDQGFSLERINQDIMEGKVK